MHKSEIPHPIRVMIVDDHHFFRSGIIQSLSLEADFEIVGEYEDGAKGIKAIRHNPPELVLLDVNLPIMNGIEVLRVMNRENLHTRAIVLTAHHEPEQALHIIRNGAYAYTSKDIKPALLVKMMRVVSKGQYIIDGTSMSPGQVEAWIEAQIQELAGPYTIDKEEFYIPLSPREMEILKYVAHGMSNQEVAIKLDISQQTVKNHMTSILRKLNVQDRTQAAITAIKHGWVRIQK